MQREIELFRKEYKKQKKLENIINSKILVRPNVKKWHVAVSFAVLPFLILFMILTPCLLNISLIYKISITLIFLLLIVEVYVRFLLIIIVKRYQAVASEEIRRRCKCIPSCSEYAIICLRKIFPLFIALLKIRKRLYKTCNGEEYKIDFPLKKMGEDFENKL